MCAADVNTNTPPHTRKAAPKKAQGKDRTPRFPATTRDGNPEPRAGAALPKRSVLLTLDEAEVIELLRILSDDDDEGALAFLRRHLGGKAHALLDSG
jgi:hypothetical protein